jgi:hypothetical protein
MLEKDLYMSRNGYLVTDELWPVILQFTPARASDQDVLDCLSAFERIYARKERCVWISFVGPTMNSKREHMRTFGEWLKKHKNDLRDYNAGTAFLANSVAFRFVLSGIFLFQTFEQPYKIFSDFDLTLKWIVERLNAEKLPMPERLGERIRQLGLSA